MKLQIASGQRKLNGRRNLVRQIRLMDRRHLLHEKIVQRGDVRVGELGVRGIGHRRIEPVAVLGDTMPHGAIEIIKTIAADTGFRIRRDIG